MELIVEVAAGATGVVCAVLAGRWLLDGILVLAFGRTRPSCLLSTAPCRLG